MSNSKVESILNEFGELLHPDLHDAKLLEIANHNETLYIKFESSSKYFIEASFKGTKEFICNSFGSQNIVLDITIDTKIIVSASDLEKIYSRPSGMLDKHDDLIERIQEKIKRGVYSFVTINPSCGCEAYILCHGVEFSTINKNPYYVDE